MKRTVVVFGLIGAGIVAALVWLKLALDTAGEFATHDQSLFIGYGIMIIALSMIFFGIKSFRDNYGGGRITFWKGVQIGLLITAIASVGYGGAWLINNAVRPAWLGTYMQKYMDDEAKKMREAGSSEAEIAASEKQLKDMAELIENPLVFFLVALIEIVPVGFLLTLISAAILRKPDVLPAHA